MPESSPQPKRTKKSVNYRLSFSRRRCRNCVMYRPTGGMYRLFGECTLVEGDIYAPDVCDEHIFNR